ncbi:MAG: pentapeptide repeat-containing protein [Actinophytocola sp.]|uniref:pentapeptide repeat-containing protein n=1 Tax=Actinophytocola sp. TaxID=1872138 RepID=UPI003C73ABE4
MPEIEVVDNDTSRSVAGKVFRWAGWSHLAAFATAATAIAALWFTNKSLLATNQQIALAQESQLAERYGRAVEQLGSDKADVRMGGIYSLERLGQDSVRDQPVVVQVLASFVRNHAPISAGCPHGLDHPLAADVQAALTVLGRRDPGQDGGGRLDLSRTCLHNADLSEAELTRVDLSLSDLWNAQFTEANLRNAFIALTDATDANFDQARLSGASMPDTVLHRATFHSADLTDAHLVTADLTDARLNKANLTGADLTDAHVAGADFTGAIGR